MSQILTAFMGLLMIAVSAQAGEVNNGAGIAENNVTFAYVHLEQTLDLCLGSEACLLSDEQSALLRRIREALPQERKNRDQLVFKSEGEEPGFFIIDGQEKVAKTGVAVGSPVYVNVQMLYTKNQDGSYAPLSSETAVAILIHELGHHHGVGSHSELDLLGVKVQSFLRQSMQRVGLGRYQKYFEAIAIDSGETRSFTRVMVRDGFLAVDLTEVLKRELRCPQVAGNSSPVRVVGAQFWNLHWGRAVGGTYPLRGNVAVYCVKQGNDGKETGISSPPDAMEFEVRIPTRTLTSDPLLRFVPGEWIAEISGLSTITSVAPQ